MILQVEVETHHISKSVVVLESPATTSQIGYINNAFEEGTQKIHKVNDKHNVRIIYTY